MFLLFQFLLPVLAPSPIFLFLLIPLLLVSFLFFLLVSFPLTSSPFYFLLPPSNTFLSSLFLFSPFILSHSVSLPPPSVSFSSNPFLSSLPPSLSLFSPSCFISSCSLLPSVCRRRIRVRVRIISCGMGLCRFSSHMFPHSSFLPILSFPFIHPRWSFSSPPPFSLPFISFPISWHCCLLALSQLYSVTCFYLVVLPQRSGGHCIHF